VYRDIPEELRVLIEPVVGDAGFELVDALLTRGRAPWLLRVILDTPEGDGRVPIEHCARVSREIGSQLDAADAIAVPYRLEVSSPGLDRVLAREKDFLLAQRQDGLGTSQVDDDRALLEAPDDAVHDLALAILVLLEDVVALGLADHLDDHLLGRLREDAPEARGVELHADLVAELGFGIEAVRLLERDLGGGVGDDLDHLAEFEELDLAEILVVAGLDLALLALRAPRGLLHGLLDRADDLLAVDSLVLGDLVDLAFQAEHARTFIWGSREERSRHA